MSAKIEPRATSWEPPAPARDADERFAKSRISMVKQQLEGMGVTDSVVLDAMRAVPRHRFVPPQFERESYNDIPLPIGYGQTIAQPYIVAVMTAALQLQPKHKVLEIGTGSGYQAAVLAEIVHDVYSIEIIEALATRAKSTLDSLGYRNIHLQLKDGTQGWPEHAPFDAIIVTAAPVQIPPALIDQLAVGGRMIIPVGDEEQNLHLLHKTAETVHRRSILPVRFVPMTGEIANGASPMPAPPE